MANADSLLVYEFQRFPCVLVSARLEASHRVVPHAMKLHFAICVVLLPLAGRAEPPVDYLRDVKPIFAKHCTQCHGADKQKSGLRLDTAASIRKGGDGGEVMVPGKSNQSRLIIAVRGGDPDVASMPPKGDKLKRDEIASIARWIDAGATAPANEVAEGPKKKSTHWAFQPVPGGKGRDRARAGSRSRYAGAPAQPRFARPAADAGGDRRLRQRFAARCL